MVDEGPGPVATKVDPATGSGDASPPGRRSLVPRTGQLVWLLVLVLLVGLVGLIVEHFARPGRDAEAPLVLRPTPSVIVAVRDLARLETAEMHVERVIDLTDRQERLFGLVDVEDAILLVAAADVVAGVDLGGLRESDVQVDAARRRVVLTLPSPEVLSTRLDSEHTYVHTRRTDVLARRREDLETRARQEAERTMQQAALDAGLLTRARTNAARTVEALVRSLGYERVTVQWAAD